MVMIVLVMKEVVFVCDSTPEPCFFSLSNIVQFPLVNWVDICGFPSLDHQSKLLQ